MSTTEKYLVGSVATLLSTEINSLADGSLAIGSAYSNVQGGAGDGYTLCDVELVVTFGVSPTASTGVSVWFLGAPDGTNYEDGGSSLTPARTADVVFPLRAVTTAQRITRRAWLPWSIFKPLLKNDGTGQSFAASANTLKVRPVTVQGV